MRASALWRPSCGALVVLLIAAVGQAAVANATSAAKSQVLLTADFPREVKMGVGPVKVSIELNLANNGKGNVTLKESNECRTRTYIVSDAKGETIEDHSICTTQYMPVSLTLRETETKKASEPVVFDSKLYQDGVEYILTYRYWGAEVQKKFKAKIIKS